MRGFRDRDFIQTREDFFFCVVGSVHPPKRVISYIKYVPSETGSWGRGEKKFNRILKKYTIPNLLDTFNFLEQKYPHYLFNSPVDNIKITAVPHQNIKGHFMPEQKLSQLREASQLDSLQETLIRFTRFLEDTNGVSKGSLGVTGSILLDIHQPAFSDIDVTVYGVEASWALHEALTENRGNELPIKYLEGNALKEWCIKKSLQYPMSAKEALKIYRRKWNLGVFEGKWVSIHPVKLEHEVPEKYGQNEYIPSGQVSMQAVVSDNTGSLFLPATYYVKDVKFLDSPHLESVTEVVSYEGLYDSLAENGETIHVKGKLERVIEKDSNHEHYRVLVGSPEGKGKEYIKLIE